jgi:hypothetical protein
VNAGSGSVGDATPTDDEVARLADEKSRLQAEVDGLRAELATAPRRRAVRTRGVVAVALVVVTSLLVTVSVTAVWARRNALNTDRYVETIGPVAQDVRVQRALGRYITDQAMSAIDPEELFESALPERGQILAAPLTRPCGASSTTGSTRSWQPTSSAACGCGSTKWPTSGWSTSSTETSRPASRSGATTSWST